MLGSCWREVLPEIMIRIIAPAAAMLAIMAVIAVASGRSPASAQTDPIVSVDAISDSSNTATTVGPIDSYASVTVGATLTVDVVVEDVTNISGFQASLLYDFTKLKVTAIDYYFLLASTGASVLDLGNTAPDTDGDFFMAAAMFSPLIVIGANGDGVLARVTFEALDSGSSPLDLTNVKLSDADGNPIPPTDAENFYSGPVNDASIAVDSSSADSDGDGVADASETACGTDPLDVAVFPERLGNGVDDDDDTLTDEVQPPVAGFDCDGDGFNDDLETSLTWPPDDGGHPSGDETEAAGQCDDISDDDGDTIVNDGCPEPGTGYQERCADTSAGNNENDDQWPADFNDDGRLNLQDVNSFNVPMKHFGQPAADHQRWNLASGPDINLQDVNSLGTLAPPMFSGERAFGNTTYGLAGTCPAD
jgi:hypothetical protein